MSYFLDYPPNELSSYNEIREFVSNQNIANFKCLLMYLNREELTIPNDIKRIIFWMLTDRKTPDVKNLLGWFFNALTDQHPWNLPILSKNMGIHTAMITLNYKCDFGYEIKDINTSHIPHFGDLLIGFLTDEFSDIKTNNGCIIKRSEFYKITIKFDMLEIDSANIPIGINKQEFITVWTCDKFPLAMCASPYTSFSCGFGAMVKTLWCFVDLPLLDYLIRSPILRHDIVYSNGMCIKCDTEDAALEIYKTVGRPPVIQGDVDLTPHPHIEFYYQ